MPDSPGSSLRGLASPGSGLAPGLGWGVTGSQSDGKRKFWRVCLGQGSKSAHLPAPKHPPSAVTQAPKMCVIHPRKGTGESQVSPRAL